MLDTVRAKALRAHKPVVLGTLQVIIVRCQPVHRANIGIHLKGEALGLVFHLQTPHVLQVNGGTLQLTHASLLRQQHVLVDSIGMEQAVLTRLLLRVLRESGGILHQGAGQDIVKVKALRVHKAVVLGTLQVIIVRRQRVHRVSGGILQLTHARHLFLHLGHAHQVSGGMLRQARVSHLQRRLVPLVSIGIHLQVEVLDTAHRRQLIHRAMLH